MAREMKDSEVEWIGEIPKEWEVVKLKRIVELYVGNSIKDEEKSKYLDNINAIPYISTKDIDIANSTINYENGMYTKIGDSNFRVAKKDSILLCIEGGSAGRKISYLLQDVSFVNKLCCFEGKINIRKKFLYYFLKSESFKSEFFLNISGLIGGVSQNLLKNFFTTLPLLEEQEKIANYLDKKVSDIDLIIEKTRATIEDYKKYKQSIITEAVTKGINPNVEMKDSGVEWIGEIPKHWGNRRLRFLGSCQNGISKSAEYFGKGFPFISYGDVYKNFILPENPISLVESNEKDRELYSVKYGDVFFTRTSETIEEIGFTSTCLKTVEDAVFAGFIIRFRPYNLKELSPYFSKYYFRSNIHRKFFVKEMNLVTRASLSQELLKKLIVLLPPLEEQNQIAEYLDKRTFEIDTLITKKEALIVELEEYKKSLIYECVTGKKEIK